jgi:antitoxin CptB
MDSFGSMRTVTQAGAAGKTPDRPRYDLLASRHIRSHISDGAAEPMPAAAAFATVTPASAAMTGLSRSSEGLEPRRRRLLYRAWHCGTRELDLVMGGFADAYIDSMSDDELACFEALIDVPDAELFAWLAGRAPVPPQFDTPLFHRFRTFHARPAAER